VPTAVEIASAEALTLDYLATLDQLADVAGAVMREIWDNLPAYDRAQMAEFFDLASPVAAAGMAEGADLVGAYLSELTGSPLAPVDLDLVVPALDAPFLHHWHQLAEGDPWVQARDAGGTQAEMLGNDVVRDGADERMAEPGVKVIGWQRIPKPGACEFCRVVATQIYRTKKSGSFGHHKCRCRPPIALTEENAAAVHKISRTRLTELRRSGAVGRVSAARERGRQR
jgi:hypothetical protein